MFPRGLLISLLNMNMVVNMVFTVAIIAVAFGAITKFQVGIFRIRSAADGTFVQISLILLGCLGGRAEVNCFLRPSSHFPSEDSYEVPAKEQQIVQNGDDGNELIQGGGNADDAVEEISRVQKGKPLHFDGDEKEQEHLHIRVKRGKGKEHG